MTDKKNILIIGATSSIARAVAMALALEGHNLCLAGRDLIELEKIAVDIQLRFQTSVKFAYIDVQDIASHQKFFSHIRLLKMPQIDGIIFAAGILQKKLEQIINTNLTGAVSLLEICANYMEQKKTGFIVGFSSVAGDRGRQSNYIYGCAKGGFNLYLQGLRQRLSASHIQVITLKLGFVDTGMTFGLPGLFLIASPEKIAHQLVRKIHQSYRITDIIYLPWFWRYIMGIIKLIPECIFKQLKL